MLFCRRNETAIWLALITALAAVLRIKGLTFQSYWFDELFSAHVSRPAHTFREVVELTLADVHPPFYQLAMWGSYKAFGYTEWAGRFPSMLAGILAIPTIFLLGRELFSKRAGLYAAALAVPNYYLVYFSQEARSYTFFYLFCCLSFFYFMRALRRDSWLDVALYIFSTILLIYTHYFGFVMLVAQSTIFLIYLALGHRRDRKLLYRSAVAMGVTLAAMLPLIPAIIDHAGIGTFWITQPQISVAIYYFMDYFSSAWLASLYALLALGAITFGVYRVGSGLDSTWVRFGVLALVLWIVIGFLLPWLRGLVAQPVITNRNTIMLIPPILLLSAYGLTTIPVLLLQRVIGLVVLVLSIVSLVVGIDYYGRGTKNQYRKMAHSLIDYKPVLPIYTLNFNHKKYNVYFEQLGSELHAVDASLLEEKLGAGVAEPLFWIGDGLLRPFETDLEERFGLVQVALYKYRHVAAELLVNPAHAKAIAMEPAMIASADGNWHSASPVVWLSDTDALLIALNESARVNPARTVRVDLLDIAGRVLESHRADLGAVPSTMQINPQVAVGDAVRLLIRLPVGEPEPGVWLIPGDAG